MLYVLTDTSLHFVDLYAHVSQMIGKDTVF